MSTYVNRSGLNPQEFNVIVEPEEVNAVTKGGLHLPDDVLTKDKNAQIRGTLVAASPAAFSWPEWPDDAPKPQPGQVVFYSRYCGSKLRGSDGNEYLVMKDADITASVTE